MRAEPGSAVWWPFGPPGEDARPRLFCLPYAGGGASRYRPWRHAAGPRLDVCPIQLPGREARIRERPFRSMPVLADALVEVLRPRLGRPYALFGYSMGALIAFEVTRRLAAGGGLAAPRALLVAAAAPPHRRRVDAPLHRLPEAPFREALRALNGTPPEVLEHEELMELVLPTLRVDFELCETYPSQPPDPLPVPILAFGGSDDASVSPEQLGAWGELTRSGFRAVTFPAGHFFLESHAAELLRHARAALGLRPVPKRSTRRP